MVVLAYLMPPVVADGVQGVDDKTFTRRCTEYTHDARGLICNVLRRASARGVEMPLPTNGPAPASEWPRQQFLPRAAAAAGVGAASTLPVRGLPASGSRAPGRGPVG